MGPTSLANVQIFNEISIRNVFCFPSNLLTKGELYRTQRGKLFLFLASHSMTQMMKRTVRGLLWHQNCPPLEITRKPDKVFWDIGWQTAHGWDTWDKVNRSYETLIAPHFCQEVPHNCVIKGEWKQNTTPWVALAGAVGIMEAHATNFPERVLERRELHRNMSLWGETS